ncbi:MAG: hypothetical protein RLZZ176_1666, partial [Cyanobacteriota bacterium]
MKALLSLYFSLSGVYCTVATQTPAYTFSVLEELVAGLRCRDLFVNKSEHWNN